MNNKKVIAVTIMSIMGISLPVFHSDSASAYTASITTSNSISLDASPSGDGTSIHAESINVQSDCRAGYNLTIATPSGSDLYKYTNNTQAGSASFTAVDGTSALNSSNNTNKWGYTLTSNPTSSTIFSPLSATSSILKTPTQTASPDNDIDDTFNINYGVKVDNNIAPGNYQMASQGAIVYYLTMDTTCTQFTVEFNPNGGTVTGGGNNPTQGIESGEPTKLMSVDSLTAPTAASYTDAANNTINGNADKLWVFWGWNTQIDGTGDWYKDKEEVTDLTNVGGAYTLYAQWKQATLADMTAAPTTEPGDPKAIDHNLMQDMKPETCYNSDITTAANAPAATLLDYRGKVTTGDNPEQPEQYTVSKLADGLCWMTTNLNLGRESGGPNDDGTITLTSDDTDLADNTTFTLPVADTTSYTDTTNLAKIRLTNNSGNNANGAYYSWAAAVANTTSTSTNPTTSICPKNWDLPASNQYTNLATKSSYSSSNRTDAAPSSFLIDGGFTNGSTFYQTSYSHYWTNNSYNTSRGYGVRVNGTSISASSSTGTTYGGNKYYRKNVRCVASLGKVTIDYDGNGTSEYPTTGSVASQTNVEISTTNTQANGFTRSDWVFNGWNTAADGTGAAITAGANISTLSPKPGDVITLYAQWLPQYTITYVNNCQSYASANSSCTQTVSNATSTQKINLNSRGNGSGTLAAYNKWTTLSGWKITGWNTAADGTGTEYLAGSTYSVTNQGAGSGVTLYAHWALVYSVQYDGNGADNTDGMGTTDANGIKSVKQTNVGEGDPVTLLAPNFKKAGYAFAGWSTNPNATLTSGDKIYGPMETMVAPAYPNNGTNIITMYAVWVAAEKDGNNNPVYLQDFGKNECDNLTSSTFDSNTGEITPGSVIALTDKRDNQIYTVAKLADGNCWMTENLRLEHAGTVGQNINDPNVTNQSLSQGYGRTSSQGNFVGLADSESANFSGSSTAANTIYKSDGSGDIFNSTNNTLEDIGTSSYPGYRFPRYNSSNTISLISGTIYTQNYANASSPSGSGTYRAANLYSYGNYYTWAAAMANTKFQYSASNPTSEDVGTSICPVGWHLPSGGSFTKEYGALAQSYGGNGGNQSGTDKGDIMSNRFRSFPNSFLYSGYFINSSADFRGTSGSYWSRSAYNTTSNSYMLTLGSTSLYSSNDSFKNYGYSVRCLADNTYTIQYDGNGADNPNGMGTTDSSGIKSVKQVEIKDDTKVTLLASNFKRAGYGFAGWSTDPDAWNHFTDNDNTNDPVIYGPMEDVVINPSVSDTLKITMYAVWVPAKKDGSNNPVYLQDFTTSDCNALTKTDFNSTTGVITPGSVIALTDKRDNQVYTISKLADNNCWITENLRLEHAGTVGNNINDSNVTNQSLSQGYGGTTGTYGNFVGLADSESANFDTVTTPNSIYKSDGSGDIFDANSSTLEDIGSTSRSYDRFPRYNNSNTLNLVDSTVYAQNYSDPTSPSDIGTNYRTESNLYSYGNYYTWAATMANTNVLTDPSVSETTGTSICPFGWRLPTAGSSSKDYSILSQQYGGSGDAEISGTEGGTTMSKRFRTFPNNFISSGYYAGTQSRSRGNMGRYWTSSASTGTDSTGWVKSFVLSEKVLNPVAGDLKYDGLTIRCTLSNS